MDDPTVVALDVGTEDATLAPYLEAAVSSKNASSIHAIVVKVLQDPDLFAGYDQIKSAMGSSEGGMDAPGLRNTLDLFSYGTYQDYLQEKPSEKYLTLNEPQLAKLRQLTVLSLVESACQQRQNSISYSSIQQALQMTAGDELSVKIRETELILSQLVAARVVVGKLSQKHQAFLIGAAASSVSPLVRPRDVHPSQVVNMIAAVQSLQTKLNRSHSFIGERQSQVLLSLEQEKAEIHQIESKWKQVVGFDGVGGFHDPMDMDRAARPVSRRNNKRSRGGFANTVQETFSNTVGM